MLIRKIKSYKLVCQNCGSEISMTAEEFDKYKKEVEGYSNSSILCTETDSNGKRKEITYNNFDCPVCGHYIATTVHSDSSDEFGFTHSNKVSIIYDDYEEMSIDDYLKKNFFGNEDD